MNYRAAEPVLHGRMQSEVAITVVKAEEASNVQGCVAWNVAECGKVATQIQESL